MKYKSINPKDFKFITMFIRNLLLFFLISATFITNAQVIITGKVSDQTNQPIEFANVVLLHNNEILKGTVTNQEGKFIIKTDFRGIFNLQISFIGFDNYSRVIDSTIDIGTIILISNNELSEFEIVERRKIIERKSDRLVFNVQNSSFLKGSDGVEVLKKTPRVNTSNDAISILGKDNFRIMINNKFVELSGGDLMGYLHSLSSNDIIKIEVITNPPSKYEAEGNVGIINIILKQKQPDFFSGNVKTTYVPATYNAGILSGNLNYKKKNWMFSSYINRAKGAREILENSTINYPSQIWTYDNIGKRTFDNISGQIMLDYSLSKNTLIGIQYSGGNRIYFEKSTAHTLINNNFNITDSILINNNWSDETNYSHALNGSIQTQLDSLGKNLLINIDYFTYNKNDRELFEAFSPSISQSKDNSGLNKIKTYSGKIDIELPYKILTIETGARISVINNNSSIKNYDIILNKYIFNDNLSNEFEYTEQNQAVYFNAKKPFGLKFKSQLGVRLESTQTKGFSVTLNKNTTNNYLNIFPTAYLVYEPHKNNSYGISYGRRINRPNFFLLNPFRYYSNIFSITEGNPLLKPSFIDNVEFTHEYKNLIQTAVYYKHIQNGFNQITILQSNNLQQIIPKNYFNANEIGISTSISFNITKFWEISNDINFYYSKVYSITPEVRQNNEGTSTFIETDNSFILNKKKTFFATINFWYQFPEISDLDESSSYSQLDIGFKILLFNENLTISISGTDLLKTNKPTFTSYNSNGIKTTFSNYDDNRRLNLSLTYFFGNNRIKSKSHEESNQQEKNRIN